MNQVILCGNLGQDPKITTTQKGNVKADLSVATSRYEGESSGERKQVTEWHMVRAWGTLAEECGKFLKKGRKVTIYGKIQTDTYPDQNGEKKTITYVLAREISVNLRRYEPTQQQPQQQPQPQAMQQPSGGNFSMFGPAMNEPVQLNQEEIPF